MILLVFGRRRRPQTLNPRNSGKLIISRAEIFSGEVLAIYLSDELGLERLRDFATIHICSLTLSVTVKTFTLSKKYYLVLAGHLKHFGTLFAEINRS